MKLIILTVCAVGTLLASAWGGQGRACVIQRITDRCGNEAYLVLEEPCAPKPLKKTGCYDSYREPYRISYPRICPTPEMVEVGNTPRALAMRRNSLLRQREMLAFEKGMIAASLPITQPSTTTGTTIYGQTDGAGVFDDANAPIPCPPSYPGPKASAHHCPATPQPVGECVVPIAVVVPGMEGYVYCPFGNNGGYIDIRGLAPGSLAKDPFSGRTFRVP